MTDIYEENFYEDEGDLIERIQEPTNEGEDEAQNDDNQGNESPKEDGDGKRIVKPKKRVTRPHIKLDATRLVGPRGIGILESTFQNVKLKGKGHELEDLNNVLRVLEHWAHRLYPKMTFDDCIDKIEDLGFKKNVIVHVKKIRMGMEDIEPLPSSSDVVQEEEEVVDPFDQLISTNPEPPQPPPLTEEQRARMLRNRLIAEEIRMKKMKAKQEALKAQTDNSQVENVTLIDTQPEVKVVNNSQDENTIVNDHDSESITVSDSQTKMSTRYDVQNEIDVFCNDDTFLESFSPSKT